MTLLRVYRATTFRLAMINVALFSVAVLVMFGIVYRSTVRSLDEQTENEIRAELTALVGERSTEGVSGLIDAIERRIDGDRSGAFLLLQGHDGKRLAGNLPMMVPRDGWTNLPPPVDPITNRRHTEHVIRALERVFEDGSLLVVGRDTHPLRQLREIIVRGFVYCSLATIAVALCIGLFTSSGVLRRLRAISVASGEIISGDLSRRLAVGKRGDEFDELASQVNAMLERIQSLVEDLQQVSNDIAHDLRTPLTRLRHRLELALLSGACPRSPVCPVSDEISGAIAEADALLATFGAMLRIAQIESGSRRAGFRKFDLSRLMLGLIETYALVAEDAGHRLHSEIAIDVVIHGDAELLTQAVVNLIENAIKHTPQGSLISVSLVVVSGQTAMCVADNGPGIPSSERARVCKRFVRLEASRSTTGNGLGLSLVAAVARLHRANLLLEDNFPGLRVTLQFPAPASA